MDKVFGIHATTTFISRHPELVQQCCFLKQNQKKRLQPLIDLCQQYHIKQCWLSKPEFEKQVGDVVHQGVFLHVTSKPSFSEDELFTLVEECKTPLLLILDTIQDPHNLGACLRTACAAGVDAVIIPKDKSVGITATVRKVACGAAEILPVCQVTNLARTLTELKHQGVWLVGLASESEQNLYECDLTGPIGFVMGAEHNGMRRLTRDTCDFIVSIPMQAGIESLNVSVATGVVLFETVRRRNI